MNIFYAARPVSAEEKRRAITDVVENARPSRDYYILVVGAVLLALAGIFLDSIPVLIASMIVAPLAEPLLLFAMGSAVSDGKAMLRALAMFVASTVVALIIAAIASLMLAQFAAVTPERVMLSFSPNYLFDIFIALISGAIAAYGLMRVKVGNAITGIGIAVSLMPPLVATGAELALGRADLAQDAAIIFILNVVGIIVAASMTFSCFGLYHLYKK